MCHSICKKQICENLFSINLPSLHLITILHIYMILPYLHIEICTVYLRHLQHWIPLIFLYSISHMYLIAIYLVGVKLVNYPHLYYFSHFTHFTLYLRKCEKYLLRSIQGVAFLTRDIRNYPCLTEASTADHCSTTHLQYRVVKIFMNLHKLVVRRLQVHKIHPAYELTQLYLLHGPLKYFEWSAAIKTLCNYITNHLELLLGHILNTDSDEMRQEKYDQSVELFSRMCKALENFVSLKHP